MKKPDNRDDAIELLKRCAHDFRDATTHVERARKNQTDVGEDLYLAEMYARRFLDRDEILTIVKAGGK